MPIKLIKWTTLPTFLTFSVSNLLVIFTPALILTSSSPSELVAQQLSQNIDSTTNLCSQEEANNLREEKQAFNFDNKLKIKSRLLSALTWSPKQTKSNQQELKLQANFLLREALKMWLEGKFRKALAKLEQSLAIRQELEDRLGEGAMILGISVLHNTLNEPNLALERGEKALEIFREIGFRTGEGLSLSQIGFAYYGSDDYEQSLLYFQQSLAIHEEIVTQTPERLSKEQLAWIGFQVFAGNLEPTQIMELIHQHLGKSVVLGFIGRVYRNQGEYSEALNYFQQELAMHENSGYLSGKGKSLKQMGTIFEETAQYPKALQQYSEAIAIYQQAGDKTGEAPLLRDLARIYFTLGEYSQSETCYQKAFTLYEQMGHPDGQGDSQYGLGLLYHDQGKYQEAVEYYQKALEFHYGADDYNGAENALKALGLTYIELDKYPEALEVFHQSIEMSEKRNNTSGTSHALRLIGIVYDKKGDYERAVEFLQQAYELQKSVEDFTGLGTVLSALGATHKNFGKLAKAEETLQNAIDVWESVRLSLDIDEKVSLLEVYKETYQNLQKVQIDLGKTNQALETAEKGRSRVLVELLARQLDPLANQLPQPEAPNVQEMVQIAQEQNATLVEYSIVEDGNQLLIWVIQPTGNIDFRSIEISFDAIGLLNLPKKLGAVRGDTELARLVRGTQQSLREENNGRGQTSDSSPYQEQLLQLNKILIEPITDLLPTNPDDRVIFIPHQELFLVPFATLRDENNKYLIDKHTILTAPSVQSLSYTRQHRQRITNLETQPLEALVVGNPTIPEKLTQDPYKLEPLSGAEQEAREIASLFENNTLLLGDDATETEVVKRIHSANIVHLATHGILDTQSYELIPGVVVLAPSEDSSQDSQKDGWLWASEIVDLTNNKPLNTELVVLSACETGLGRILGEGVYGLSYSLITAGVPSLVVSLWQVSDGATQVFMKEFYQEFQATGDKAQALRQAMLKIKRDYEDPGIWGAFTLIGEAQ